MGFMMFYVCQIGVFLCFVSFFGVLWGVVGIYGVFMLFPIGLHFYPKKVSKYLQNLSTR